MNIKTIFFCLLFFILGQNWSKIENLDFYSDVYSKYYQMKNIIDNQEEQEPKIQEDMEQVEIEKCPFTFKFPKTEYNFVHVRHEDFCSDKFDNYYSKDYRGGVLVTSFNKDDSVCYISETYDLVFSLGDDNLLKVQKGTLGLLCQKTIRIID